MTLVAKRETVGFELINVRTGFPSNPVPYKLKPNQAFKKGQLVLMPDGGQADAGLLVPATHDNGENKKVVGVMAEEIAQADNPSAAIRTGLVYDNPANVYRASITGHTDASVASNPSNTTTRIYLASVTHATNARGALVYFYEGPGSPALRLIKAAHTDNYFDIEEPLSAIPTVATKLIYFSDAALATDGTNIGATLVRTDADGIKVTVSTKGVANNGFLNIVGADPANLMVDVMIAASRTYMLA